MSDIVYNIDVIEEVYDVATEDVFVVNSFIVSHIVKDIAYNTFPFTLGTIPNGYLIHKVIIKVIDEFDDGFITIGTDEAQGILIGPTDCDLTKKAIYINDIYYNTIALTTYKVFYTGSSTKGQIQVMILYQ